MPAIGRDNGLARHDDPLYQLAKTFFGFGDKPHVITIVLPNPERTRPCTLKNVDHYPVFKHEVSPDDMYSAARVYSLLTYSYGEVVQISFEKDEIDVDHPNMAHTVLIGAPYTNRLTRAANDYSDGHGIRFAKSERDRSIIGANNTPYTIGFSKPPKGRRSIIRDYCYLSRRHIGGDKIEFIIAGLRAYGQWASFTFLSDESFYHEALGRISNSDDFQMIVDVPVCGKRLGKCKIVECNTSTLRDDSPNADRFVVDRAKFEVRYKGKECYLGSTKKFFVIERLNQQPGRYVEIRTLQQEIWGDHVVEPASVQRQISDLRKALKKAGIEGVEIDAQPNTYRLNIH